MSIEWNDKMDKMYGISKCGFCGCRCSVSKDELCEACREEIDNDELIGYRIDE